MRARPFATTFVWALIVGSTVGFLCLYVIGPSPLDELGRAGPVPGSLLVRSVPADASTSATQQEPSLIAPTQSEESDAAEFATAPPVPPPIIPSEILNRWATSEYFADHFDSEPIDAAWAAAMEAQIMDSFALLSEVSFSQIQTHCRRTMCRIEVIYRPDTDSSAPRPENYYHELLGDRIKAVIRNGGGRVNSLSTADLNYDVPDPRSGPNSIGPTRAKVWIGYVFNRSSLPPPEFLQGAPDFRENQRPPVR